MGSATPVLDDNATMQIPRHTGLTHLAANPNDRGHRIRRPPPRVLGARGRGGGLVGLDVDPVFVEACLGEVVVRLETHPELGV